MPLPNNGKVAPNTFAALPGQVRFWGIKSATTLVDQSLTSAASFGVNVLIARWMRAPEYGAFAVAFAAYLFLTGFHNALLLEPSSVIGPARHAQNLLRYFATQIQVHGLLIWPLGAAALGAALILGVAVPHSPLIGALAGSGVALPFLLLLWLARRMCYVLQKPSIAVSGSATHFVVSLGAICIFRMLGLVTPSNAFFALALGSVAGSLLIFRLMGIRHSHRRDLQTSLRIVLGENWRYGRWLVGSSFFYAIYTSIQTFYVAGRLGLADAGALRAMQVPSLVMTQVIAAIGLLVLPSLSFDFGGNLHRNLRHKAIVVSIALGAAAIVFAAALAVIKSPLESLLYGGKYAQYVRLIPVLALIPVANGLCTGYSMALRASQLPHFDLIANACGAVTAAFSTPFLVREFGVIGAAISMVLSFVAANLMTLIVFSRMESAEIATIDRYLATPLDPSEPNAPLTVDNHV
jgi:hypothetical protein